MPRLREKFKSKIENQNIDEFEEHKIRLLNKLIYAICLIAFISGILVFLFDSFKNGIISFLFIPILLLSSFFIHIGKIRLAFVYFILSDFIAQTILVFIAPSSFGLANFYLIIPFLVYIFLEEMPLLRTVIILLSLILFAAAQFFYLNYEPILANNNATLVRILTFTVYFIVGYFLVRFFLIETKTYRKKNNLILNQLKVKNNNLQNFNKVAAHDLKEPLNSVIGFASLIEARFAKSESTKELEVEALLHIKDASNRMKQLLDDMMAYSVSEYSIKDAKKVELNEILIDVKKNLYAAIERTKAKIIVSDLPTIQGNRNFMTQLFQNLVANAIKFQPKIPNKGIQSPFIEIKAFTKEKLEYIQVIDNGIGIPKDKLHSIFEPYKRLNNSSKYKGSGLGLATCKNIVMQFGGEICVESEVGNGTTFILSFPSIQ